MKTTTFHMARHSRRLPAGAPAIALLLSAAFTMGCEAPAKTAVDQAAFTDRTRCGLDVKDSDLAPVFEGHSVETVAPLYSTIEAGKSGEQSRLRGAILTFGALPGETAEWLDRELECHSARVTLGQVQSLPDDPFWLPGSTLDIDVRPTRDGLVVGIAGYSAADARKVLDRAQSFARTRAPAASAP